MEALPFVRGGTFGLCRQWFAAHTSGNRPPRLAQRLGALREHQTEFGEQAADAVDQRSSFDLVAFAQPVHRQVPLLIGGLDRHEPHLRPAGSFADGSGVVRIVLAAFASHAIGRDEVAGNEPHVKAKQAQSACDMVRTAAGLRNKDLPERFLRDLAQSDVHIFIFRALVANKELTRRWFVIFRTPIANRRLIFLCALVHHPRSGGYAFFSFSVDNFSKYWELEMGRRAKTAGLRTLCALIFGVLIGSVLAAQTTAISASSPASAAASATQVRLEDYYLLAISVSEGVAVLRGPDRHLTTLRVGTTLAPARARLAQVLGDRLRFDTFDDKGGRQTAWMIRSANPEQLPQVQRVSGNPPTAPSMDAKSAVTVAPLSASPSTSK